MNKTRVLSIDFDYFQRVSEDTLKKCYPDGIDNGTEISKVVWASHYADKRQAELLEQVGINEDELTLAKQMLTRQKKGVPVLVTNSHRHIYDFIHDYVEKSKGLIVTNVDMHHDFENDNSRVDCGNWIGFLNKEYEHFKWNWIMNEVTDDMYGLQKGFSQDLIRTSLAEIADESYDMVFICRSDIWTPPHLDKYFDDLLKTAIRHFDKVLAEQAVSSPREIDDIIKSIKFHTQQYEKKNTDRKEISYEI